MKPPDMLQGVIREAGNVAESRLAPEEVNTERSFAVHLAAHAAVEELLTGTCTKALDMREPCPYCGKLPPDWAPGEAMEAWGK